LDLSSSTKQQRGTLLQVIKSVPEMYRNSKPLYVGTFKTFYKNRNIGRAVLFFFQALNFLVESFGLLNYLFPFPSILDAGYPVFDLYLASVQINVIPPSPTLNTLAQYQQTDFLFS
jgi:hypothetical protein